MARPKKDEQTRDTRADLVHVARRMFLTDGYDAIAVNAIIEAAGLSKGTFYYHFGTKSDLLDAVVEQITLEGWQAPRAAIEHREGSAIDRINRFMEAARRWRRGTLPRMAKLTRAMYLPENAQLRERMWNRRLQIAAPALAECLRDGKAEQVLGVDDPESAARVFLVTTGACADDLVRTILASDESEADLHRSLMARSVAMLKALESLLGAPAASLAPPDERLLKLMIRHLRMPRFAGVDPPAEGMTQP